MQVQQAEWAANRTSKLVPSYRESRVFDFAEDTIQRSDSMPQ